jgi:hypothetical protein
MFKPLAYIYFILVNYIFSQWQITVYDICYLGGECEKREKKKEENVKKEAR